MPQWEGGANNAGTVFEVTDSGFFVFAGTPGKPNCHGRSVWALAQQGRAQAVARGVKMGRPPKLTPHQQKEAIKRRDEGNETLADIGRSYNVSSATISRLVA